MWLLLVALVVSLGAVVTSTIFVILRATALLRGFRAAGRAVESALASVAASAGRAGGRVQATDNAARLDESLERLQRSRARLRVLLAAWSDARKPVGRVAAFVPRK